MAFAGDLRPAVWGAARYADRVIRIQAIEGGVTVDVKVVPGASRERLLGEWNGRARIAVAAAAEGGKANKAVEALLAKLVGVRRRDVAVQSGHGSPLKTVRIAGVDERKMRAAMGVGVSE